MNSYTDKKKKKKIIYLFFFYFYRAGWAKFKCSGHFDVRVSGNDKKIMKLKISQSFSFFLLFLTEILKKSLSKKEKTKKKLPCRLVNVVNCLLVWNLL